MLQDFITILRLKLIDQVIQKFVTHRKQTILLCSSQNSTKKEYCEQLKGDDEECKMTIVSL